MTLESFGHSPYKIETLDPNQTIIEVNRVFALISDRLDKLEGLRGRPQLYNKLTTGFDLIVTSSDRGLILRDLANPPHYWRVTVSTIGGLDVTDLGTTYE